MRNDWLARVREAFRTAGAGIDADVAEELAQHAESTFDDLQRDGASEAEAHARVDALIRDWCTDPIALHRAVGRAPAIAPPPAGTALWMGAWADVIYGLRVLRSRPGTAAMTVLTIALGIAAVTTLFSVAYGVLLRPLPWGNTDRLVRVSETRGGKQGRVPDTMMNGSYRAWAEAPQTLESIGTFSENPATLTGVGEAARIPVARVTPSTLQMLNPAPERGRIFASNEGARTNDQSSVVVIAHGLWEQRFGRRDDVVGQTLVLDGVPHTIVGVMPRDFRFPTAETRAWTAWEVPPVDNPNGVKTGTIMRVIARLKPGVTLAQASAEGTARAIAAPDAGPVGMALFGARDPIRITVEDAVVAATADVRPAILVLLAAAALLFVTAIANVANMQLARASARQRELTIRSALGAAMPRLARQLLIENALVGLLGGASGLGLTIALNAALPSILPAGFPRVDAIQVDGRVLAMTLVLSILASVICGVLPLMRVRRLDLVRSLGDGSGGSAGAGRGRTALMRAGIVASQVAVTCVLIVGGVVLARSLAAQIHADRGYDPTNLLTASVPFPSSYTVERREQALSSILERVTGRPGVVAAAMSSGLPLVSSGGYTTFNFASSLRGGANVDVESIRRLVTPGYFNALGIRVRAGRALTEADAPGAPLAVVVNRTFVAKYLDGVPDERALGVSLGSAAVRMASGRADAFIVGVVDDLKQDQPNDPPQAEMFVSLAQQHGLNVGSQAFVVVRTADDPAAHVEGLRSALREADPTIALDAVMTMDQRVGESMSRPRLYAALFLGFAICALIIASAGMFGVLSQSVVQRARELAVRSALGASRAAVLVEAMRHAGLAMMAGVAIGLVASVVLSDALEPFIYGVSARDWLSFGAAPVALLLAGVIACLAPAQRIARTDPSVLLKDG